LLETIVGQYAFASSWKPVRSSTFATSQATTSPIGVLIDSASRRISSCSVISPRASAAAASR
jgi:hypothetical protein